jgi:hypothetical protein
MLESVDAHSVTIRMRQGMRSADGGVRGVAGLMV